MPGLKRRIAGAAVLASFGLMGCAPGVGADFSLGTQQSVLAETGIVYALVETEAELSALRSAAQGFGMTAGAEQRFDALGLIFVPVTLPDTTTGAEAIDLLEGAVPGSVVGVNHAYRLQSTVSQPVDPRAYAAALMNWPENSCRARVRIGLIDGGVDPATPALKAARVIQESFAEGSQSGLRHGTEVASILADPSRLRGITLLSANVMADEGGDSRAGAAQIVQALGWLAQEDVGVVNISLAGPKNKLLARAVRAATEDGMTVVAAAGNSRHDAPVQFPAALPSVVAVTAVDANMRVYRSAGRGDHIDVAAPGVDVFVETSFGARYVTGTSIAAPFVTSRLALEPAAGPEDVTAQSVDLGAPGHDPVFGHGLAQAPNSCG